MGLCAGAGFDAGRGMGQAFGLQHIGQINGAQRLSALQPGKRPHRPGPPRSEQNKKLSSAISFFLKPKAKADNQSGLMRVFPLGARH